MTVHDIHVNEIGTALRTEADSTREVREIGRQNRR